MSQGSDKCDILQSDIQEEVNFNQCCKTNVT